MDTPNRPLRSVLVKPAGPDCNLECRYCFYLKKAILFPEAQRHRMKETILDELIRQVMTQGGSEVSFKQTSTTLLPSNTGLPESMK